MAVAGVTVVVGASGESSNATGVNGDQSNNLAFFSGAAYVFNLSGFTNLGGGLAGIAGIPLLEGTGTLTAGSSVSFALSSAAHSAPTLLFASLNNTPAPFKGGVLIPAHDAVKFALSTGPGGNWTLPISSWPTSIPSGTAIYFQVAVKDLAAINGVSISNALQGTQP